MWPELPAAICWRCWTKYKQPRHPDTPGDPRHTTWLSRQSASTAGSPIWRVESPIFPAFWLCIFSPVTRIMACMTRLAALDSPMQSRSILAALIAASRLMPPLPTYFEAVLRTGPNIPRAASPNPRLTTPPPLIMFF